MKKKASRVGNTLRPLVRCVRCRTRKVRKEGLVWCRTCSDEMRDMIERLAAVPLEPQE